MTIRLAASIASDDTLRVEVDRLPEAGDMIEVGDPIGGARVYAVRFVKAGDEPVVTASISEGDHPTMKGRLV